MRNIYFSGGCFVWLMLSPATFAGDKWDTAIVRYQEVQGLGSVVVPNECMCGSGVRPIYGVFGGVTPASLTLPEALKHMGEDGFELVTVLGNGRFTTMYFKKKLDE